MSAKDDLCEDLADRLVVEGLKRVQDALSDAGIQVSPWTAIRWARRGVKGKRLDAVKVGGVWMTTDAAVRRFLTTHASEDQPARYSVKRDSSKAVEQYLEGIGLGRETCD